MRRWIVLALLCGGCAPGETILLLPDLAPALESALLFVQSGDEATAIVREAYAIDLSTVRPIDLEARAGESLRLIGYESSLSELELLPGKLRRPLAGRGRPLEPADFEFVAAVGDELAWAPKEPALQGAIPWELPPLAPVQTVCQRAEYSGWQIPSLTLVDPKVIAPITDDEFLLGGHFAADTDPEVANESMLVRVHDLESEPVVVEIGVRWPGETIRGLVLTDDRSALGVSNHGRRFRVDLDTLERTDAVGSFNEAAGWELARGRDGFVVMYDGKTPGSKMPMPVTGAPYVLDPATLEIAPFDVPEPIADLELIDASFMLASAQGRLYRYDDSGWALEAEVEGGAWITDIAADASGQHFMAVVGETYVMSRSPDGQWDVLPEVKDSFGIEEGVFLPSGEYVVGGAAGVVNIWDGEQWCTIEERPFSRALRALGTAQGSARPLTVNYSESVRELLGVGRIDLRP